MRIFSLKSMNWLWTQFSHKTTEIVVRFGLELRSNEQLSFDWPPIGVSGLESFDLYLYQTEIASPHTRPWDSYQNAGIRHFITNSKYHSECVAWSLRLHISSIFASTTQHTPNIYNTTLSISNRTSADVGWAMTAVVTFHTTYNTKCVPYTQVDIDRFDSGPHSHPFKFRLLFCIISPSRLYIQILHVKCGIVLFFCRFCTDGKLQPSTHIQTIWMRLYCE